MKKKSSQFISPEGLKTFPLHSRPGKVHVSDFAGVPERGMTFRQFVDGLPDFLAARDFKEFLILMRKAKQKKKPIIFALGAHVIKVGLSRLLITLMEEGWMTAVAFNGAGIIHDFEIAYCGMTSEDVDVRIKKGEFGMAKETGEMLNRAVNSGKDEGLGLGEAVGKMIASSDFPYRKVSLLAAAYSLRIPATVHVALGTDTIHFHPEARGDAIGETSLRDFFRFSSCVRELEGGGVFVNIGSAVVLPEVFLKAVSFVRNKGYRLENFSTAVFDFIRHYRPSRNVCRRPPGEMGKGFYFVGHHEIMIPLLAAALRSGGGRRPSRL